MAEVFVFDERGMYTTFQSRDGEVGRDLTRRATRVQIGAKRQVGKDTHRLERNIVKRWDRGPSGRGAARAGDLVVQVGAWGMDYAYMHHQGTRPHIIRPRNPNGLLRFVKNGQVIFAKVVHHPGTAPNHYLSDQLVLAVV
jgi:hypothetical protein